MNSSRKKLIAICLLVVVLTGLMSACANPSDRITAKSVRPRDANTSLRDKHSTQNAWLQMNQLADSMNLRLVGRQNEIQMGYTDPIFEVVAGRKEALSFGKQITLPDAPIRHDGWVYISPRSAEALLQTQVHRDGQTGKLSVASLSNASGPERDESGSETGTGRIRVLSLPSDRSQMVSYAKRFLGVPYEFGADDYSKSKTFDCSSFTQHIFDRFGVSLPRLAREQAREGNSVSRSNLKAGDLIFFTVPGRFSSDRIAGHVGMYIGNGRFIHTWGDPGVQISPLDSGYWNDQILSMRRIQ